MTSWVRRTVALAALAGAAWLAVLARGVRGEAHTLLAPFFGDGIVALAGLLAVVCIGLAMAIVFSPAGKARGWRLPST
jgi:hypothetical protein